MYVHTLDQAAKSFDAESSDIIRVRADLARDQDLYLFRVSLNSLIDAYIHEQSRPDVLPGWEYWGILPSGERIYASTRDKLRRRIYAAIVERK
jgi:hypothetical protein